MENNLNNRDFEQFVKQNADQYRMFPSEKVWKNIHHTLHNRRRWYGLGLFILLLTSGIVTWVMLSPSAGNTESLAYNPATETPGTVNQQKNKTAPILIKAEKTTDKKTNYLTTTESLQEIIINAFPEIDKNSINESEVNTFTSVMQKNDEKTTNASPVMQDELSLKKLATHKKTELPFKTENKDIFIQPIINTPVLTDSRPEEIISADKKTEPVNVEASLNNTVTNVSTAKKSRSGKKMSWEVYITPTVSYRKLEENKDFINTAQANNNLINYTSFADINSLVTHRPDMGLQLGFNAGYPITKSLKITGGLQFNVSKYDIKASFSTGDIATIALNSGGGSNSVSTISNYRNTSSASKADWLRNFYFSASVPVGLELKLSGNNKKEFGISGTIQPTYVLSDRAYLLSTDYKNYVEVPSLIRRWNMNTSLGFYAGFTTGKLDWRIGPQARYQLKSSFKSIYPVKEHLFDFGLKAGIILNK
jgi:hypothetical protein